SAQESQREIDRRQSADSATITLGTQLLKEAAGASGTDCAEQAPILVGELLLVVLVVRGRVAKCRSDVRQVGRRDGQYLLPGRGVAQGRQSAAKVVIGLGIGFTVGESVERPA